MLKIINPQGDVLYLKGDQVIPVERNNPLFNDQNEFFQDISYQVTVPPSENSKLFFKMGHLVETTTDYYIIKDIKLEASGAQMLAGNIRYRVTSAGFEANIEPNFAAIKSLMTNIRLTEIRTEDAEYGFTDATYEARMLDTCVNPDKYNYIFFPVKNPNYATTAPGNKYDFVNYYNTTTQKFDSIGPPGWPFAFDAANTPFFKLGYIIKQVAAYLGFTATGSYFTDPGTKNRCIYTRFALNYRNILPSMTYMPNMLIADFLKQVRDREHIIFDFDLASGELRVESFKTLTSKTEAIDLTPHITFDGEMEVAPGQDLTVTIRSDEQDAQMAVVGLDGNNIYPPVSTLVAGAGTTPVELACGTLKSEALSNGVTYPITDQSVVFALGAGQQPEDINYTDPNDPTTLNNWPLRILNFLGYLPVTGGGHYPCGTGHDLNGDDIAWYKFLNDSKNLYPELSIPALVLAGLKISDKFIHRTAGRNYVTYIAEQIAYDVGADVDAVRTKIKARIYNYNPNTKVSITPYSPPTEAGVFYNMGSIKAYFDPDIHGIKVLTLTFVGHTGDNYTAAPISHPANKKGAGGVASIIQSATTPADSAPVELRITQGHPKYLLHRGLRTDFVKVGDYYKVSMDLWGEFAYIPDLYVIFF